LEFCDVEEHGRLLIVTMRRPEVLNAFHPPAHFEIAGIFNEFARRPDLWVAILTGAGDRAFSAGDDLKFFQAHKNVIELPPEGLYGLTHRTDLHKPVIAAVNGLALGGGFEAVLACDLVVASEHATFALPEPLVGLAATAGGVSRLAQQIPLKHAMGIILTGRHVSAREAQTLGFVNEVVPTGEALAAAKRWAEAVLKCAPLAVRASKSIVLDDAAHKATRQALSDSTLERQLLQTEDALEGPTAFVEKRPPNWQAR
jgi:crotonobetainyl-CoA hydratase